MSDNRRVFGRMKPTSNTVVIHGFANGPLPGELVDESFGGVAVLVPLRLTQKLAEVTVERGAIQHIAYVRHMGEGQAGTKLGLEWKAQAIQRCLKKITNISLSGEGPNQEIQHLARILPGGISMLWKLAESKNWVSVYRAAERLKNEANGAGIYEILELIDDIKDQIRAIKSADSDPAELESGLRQMMERLVHGAAESIVRRLNESGRCPA